MVQDGVFFMTKVGFKFHVNTHRVIPILVVEETDMSSLNVSNYNNYNSSRKPITMNYNNYNALES